MSVPNSDEPVLRFEGDRFGVISVENLGDLRPETWREWQKKVATRAIRVSGPFRVMTSESENEPFLCEDGYLAVDARGYPYAIAADEFALIYAPKEEA